MSLADFADFLFRRKFFLYLNERLKKNLRNLRNLREYKISNLREIF